MGMGKRWNFFFHILPPGFDPKLAIFPTFFFLANIGQENVFYYILEALNVPQRTSTHSRHCFPVSAAVLPLCTKILLWIIVYSAISV